MIKEEEEDGKIPSSQLDDSMKDGGEGDGMSQTLEEDFNWCRLRPGRVSKEGCSSHLTYDFIIVH